MIDVRKLFAVLMGMLLCSPALGQSANPILVDLRTATASGTVNMPFAPVLDASYTKADVAYHQSEYFSTVTGDANTALCSASFAWTVSGAGTAEYYVRTAALGDPSLASTLTLFMEGQRAFAGGTLGSLKPGQCTHGDNDTLGYSTWYCRTWEQIDPDAYGDDADITAVTGQGAYTWYHGTTCTYDNTTGVIDCPTGAFVHYPWLSGDRILIKHANINSGTKTWTQVSSITDVDTITVAAGLSAAGNLTSVEVFSHQQPGDDMRFYWVFTGTQAPEQTDDRPQAASTTIAHLTFTAPMAAPIFVSSGGYTLTVYDDVNGINSSAYTTTGSYTSGGWSGAREIYIDAAGTDVGSCTGGVVAGCTVGSPCQTLPCGMAQLRLTVGPAILYLKRGDTYVLAANMATGGSDVDDKLMTTHGSGADPVITATGFTLIGGTWGNLRMEDITVTGGGGVKSFNGPTCNNCLFQRLSVTGGGQQVVDMDGIDWVWADSYVQGNSSNQYAFYSMGGDAVSGHSVRRRAIINNEFNGNNNSDAIVRVRTHSLLFAGNRSVVTADSGSNVFACLRLANDNHPNNYAHIFNNYLHREAGTSTTPVIDSISQSGGSFDHFRVEGNWLGTFSAANVRSAWEHNSASPIIDNVRLRNNEVWTTVRGWKAHRGKTFVSWNNTAYLPRTGTVEWINIDASNGYERLWAVNDVVSAPNMTGGNAVMNRGADSSGARCIVHKSHFNLAAVSAGQFFRWQGDDETPAEYETDHAGLDILGGSGGSAIDPLLANIALKDLRPCTGSGVPDASCSGASPLLEAGSASYPGLDYRLVTRTSSDIGAISNDAASGIHPALLHYYFLNQRR